MGNNVNKLLATIDHGKQKHVKKSMEKLFDTFDKDKTGYLENDQFESLLQDLVKYIETEADLIGDVPGGFEKETHDWIKDTLDSNHDGKCSRDEFMKGIEKVLHEELAKVKEKVPDLRTLGGSEGL